MLLKMALFEFLVWVLDISLITKKNGKVGYPDLIQILADFDVTNEILSIVQVG